MRIAPVISNFTKRRYLYLKNQATRSTVFANLSPTDEAACRITRPRDPSAPPSAYGPTSLKYRLFITVKYLPNRQEREQNTSICITNMASKPVQTCLCLHTHSHWTNERSVEKAVPRIPGVPSLRLVSIFRTILHWL